MPGYPNTASGKSCCIPSTTIPSSTRYCGCSTSSTSLIPQKVILDLTRVVSTAFYSDCINCTNLNGSYTLYPSTRDWGTTYCYYEWHGTIALSPFPSPYDSSNCASKGFHWLAWLEITQGTTNARWVAQFRSGTHMWAYDWIWTFKSNNQSPIPVPWQYPCLTINDSTYFYYMGPSYKFECNLAWDSTLRVGGSTLLPHITINPSSST